MGADHAHQSMVINSPSRWDSSLTEVYHDHFTLQHGFRNVSFSHHFVMLAQAGFLKLIESANNVCES